MLCSRLKWTRSFSSIVSKRYVHRELKEPQFDLKYLLDPTKLEEIEKNIHDRKGVGDIKLVQELHKKLQHENTPRADKINLNELFKTELSKIPNKSHPDAASLESPKVVEYFNAKPSFQNGPLDFSEICKKLNILRTDHLGNFTGPRSYYLMSDLAELASYRTFFSYLH
jgi:seryl-tRNA synthetase